MDTRALIGISAALGMAAGIGIGYAAFHGDSAKQTPAAAPVAAASSVSTSASSASSGFTLAGKLTLKWSYGAFVRNENSRCGGSGGYSDITEGAAVTITDQGGTVIATGQLDAGHAEVGDSNRPISCTFTFSVLHVPGDKTFYGVQVSHRGAIQFSADRAKSGDVGVSLGGS